MKGAGAEVQLPELMVRVEQHSSLESQNYVCWKLAH